MVEAATEFRKNSFNDEDSAQLAKVAAMFTNVADEAISAGDAAEFIISQMIAFGIEADNASSIIDKVNETANKFAVSSGDLATALKIVASTSSAMGNNIDETLGIVTAITEQTKNASKAARGANAIFANLAQVLDDTSSNGKKITQIFNDIGVAMYDQDGQLKSAYDLLSGLSDKWDTLDGNTQKYIATTLAGTTQLNNFLALMNNFEHAATATETAMDSLGSATRENTRYMRSIEASVTSLKAHFQELATSIISSDLVKYILKFAEAMLDFADTGLGQVITKILLLTGIGWGTSSLLSATKILSVVSTQFKNFGTIVSSVASGATSLSGAIGAAGGVMSAALPTVLALVTAGTALYHIIKPLIDKWHEAHPTVKEIDERLESLNSKLETNADRLSEINQMRWYDLTPDILAEKQAIEEENAALREQIDLLNGKKDAIVAQATTPQASVEYSFTSAGGERVSQTFETLNEWYKYLDELRSGNEELFGLSYAQIEEYLRGIGDSITRHYNVAESEMADLYNSLVNNGKLTADEMGRYNDVMAVLKSVQEEYANIPYSQLTDDVKYYIDWLNKLNDAYDKAVLQTDRQNYAYQKQVADGKEAADTARASLNEAIESGAVSKETINQAISDMTSMGMDYVDVLEYLANKYKALKVSISSLRTVQDFLTDDVAALIDSIGKANDAWADFNKNGRIAVDALQEIQDNFSDVDGIDKYIQALAKTGVTSTEVEDIIGELITKKIQLSYTDDDLAQANQGVVATLLEEAGVANANSVALGLIYTAKIKNAIANANSVEGMMASIAALESEANQAGITKTAFYDLIAQCDIFNNTNLDVSQKLQALQQLAVQAKLTGSAMQFTQGLGDFMNKLAGAGVNVSQDEAQSMYWDYLVGQAGKTNPLGVDLIPPSGGGGGGSSSSKTTATDKQLESLKSIVELRKSELSILEKSDGTELKRVEKTKEIMSALKNQIDYMKKSGAAQNEINDLTAEYLSYQNKIKDIYDEIIAARKKVLESQKSDMETVLDTVVDAAQKEIDKINDAIDAVNDKYDAQIDALEAANDELESQIALEEKLNALAQAKSKTVLVYKDGQFQYVQDADAVSSAQSELDAYNRERQLEKEKEALEASRDAELKILNDKLDYWQNYVDVWSGITSQYTEAQNKLLTEQMLGIDMEKSGWETRLGNLQAFADQYNAILSSIGALDKIDTNAIAASGGVDLGVDYASKMLSAKTKQEFDYWTSYRDAKMAIKGLTAGTGPYQTTEQLYSQWQSSKKYARGTLSARGGMSLVGENGPELRVLNKGDGILPADITRNLWNWGKLNPNISSGGQTDVFNISNLTLPNVRDAESLVNGLKQMAYQRAYKRA